MKPREYCCCAVPMINAGIYTTLSEQFVLGILVGVLAVATPSIVGASTPSSASSILAVLCFIGAGVQILGFIGVARERSILYRRYVTLHGLITCAIFSVAAVWIIISATRHTSAKTKCIASFFSGNLSGSSEGDTLCNIFAWVDVGIMGGLWVILAILQAYLYAVMSSYGSSQRRDHDKYDQLDPSQPLTGSTSIPLHDRADPWDSRPSTDSLQVPMNGGNQYTHVRQVSTISASDVLSEPHQQPKDSLSNAEYGHRPSLYRPYSDGHGSEQLSYPSYAYTYEPSPTPVAGNYYDNETAQTERPRQAQTHPAEGTSRRKTPRLPGADY